MSVKAKMRVHLIDKHKDQNGEVVAATVKLSAVYSPDKSSENYSWSQATPGGEVYLYISNPAAFEQFELNGEYLLTFEKVGA